MMVCDSRVTPEVLHAMISLASADCEYVWTVMRDSVKDHLSRLSLTSQVLSSRLATSAPIKKATKWADCTQEGTGN